MDDSEVDVDIDTEDVAYEQLSYEAHRQTTLEPHYEQGEEEPSELEEEAEKNGAEVGYTVYYQDEEARQAW